MRLLLVTIPLPLGPLVLNVDASEGELFVEILDGAGNPIEGFSGKKGARARNTDHIAWAPRWKGAGDLSALRDRKVRLKWTLRQARLYSFQVQ